MARSRPHPQVPRSRSLSRWGWLAALAVALLAPAAAHAAAGGLRCEELTVDVALAPGDAAVYPVYGVLCAKGSLEHKTVQIALHGSTYSHQYWDWPLQPEIYSYVRYATAAGYAVLNIDRIGIGRSGHPPAAAVTIGSNAYVVHQLVDALRNGHLVVRSFGRIRADRVALVGHSLGSLIAIQEAATYGDVDGVVLTGISHTITPVLGESLSTFVPANLDPHFAGRAIPDGYLTTGPGGRSLFYNPPFFDPAVLALDEASKETVTLGELDTAVPALGLSGGVHTPVLVLVGDADAAFCNPPTCSASGSLAGEPAFYPADSCALALSIPGSGHDLNLHFQAPVAYGVMLAWMDLLVGKDTRHPAPLPCAP